jgi:hypothetical protein
MDADDISMPERLGFQFEALTNDPKLVLVGCSYNIVDQKGKILDTKFVPTLDEDCKRALWIGNPFAHGSVAFRKQAVIKAGGYKEKVGPIEDYELWIRLAKLGKFSALPRVLFSYRLNNEGISLTNNSEQQRLKEELISKMWAGAQPKFINYSQLKEKFRHYIAYTEPNYAINAKQQVTRDIVTVAFKTIRFKKNILGAVKQLLIVSFSGRTGLKIVIAKILNLSPKGLVKK